MRIEKTKLTSPDFAKIQATYYEAFPKVEKLPMWFMKMMVLRGRAEFVSIYDGIKWVGFMFTILDAQTAYIFFLAIGKDYRSQGYGSRFLDLAKRRYIQRKLGLSAERPLPWAPNNEQRQRRQAFYARNGFEKAGFYTQEAGDECYDFLTVEADFPAQDYVKLMDWAMFPLRMRYLPLTVRRDDEPARQPRKLLQG